mgnify:CR=1 FL=1
MRREEWWSDEMTAEQQQHFYKIREHQLGQYRLDDWRDITASMRQAAERERGRKRHGVMRRT